MQRRGRWEREVVRITMIFLCKLPGTGESIRILRFFFSCLWRFVSGSSSCCSSRAYYWGLERSEARREEDLFFCYSCRTMVGIYQILLW